MGTFSAASFLTGLWQSVHIDDLCQSTVMVSDVTRLQDVTISQLFKPEGDSECKSGGSLWGRRWDSRSGGRERGGAGRSPLSPRTCPDGGQVPGHLPLLPRPGTGQRAHMGKWVLVDTSGCEMGPVVLAIRV